MINNFQLKPRYCKDHQLKEQFICTNKECQSKSLLCSDCARSKHSSHFYDIRSIQNFIESFKQKVKFYESQFEKDKIIIHIKDIIANKISEVNQNFHQTLINVMKVMEKQRQIIIQNLKQIQQKHEQLENQYKKTLQERYECLEYLSAYKNSPKALQAKLLCSNVWGVSSLKNSLLDIKNLSANQSRDVNLVKNNIMQEIQKNFREDSFLTNLKKIIHDYDNFQSAASFSIKNISLIQKAFLMNNQNNIINTSRSSRMGLQRPRTHSLSGLYPTNLSRVTSNPNIQIRNNSLEKICKVPSSTTLQSDKQQKILGLRRVSLSKMLK